MIKTVVKGNLNTSYGNYPVTMYDVDKKKPVAIFKSCRYASIYVFGESRANIVTTKSILAKRKHEVYSPGYKVIVTFRSATPDQKIELGDKNSLILDGRFINPDKERKEQVKKEKTYDVVQAPNVVREDRNKQAIYLLKNGHTVKEITKKLEISDHTVRGIINENKVISVHNRVSDLDIDGLREIQVVINNRIKLLESEEVSTP